jgi:AraC family transcriptional regulator
VAAAAIGSAARAEYHARILRVTDYIERHLDRPLTLEELAGVACFSPFHFHRVFSAVTGEPLYRYVLRLRLERAASRLARDERQSVTAIALDCGFGSSAAFARAFKAAFGVSASEWRSRLRKIREADRKAGEASSSPGSYDLRVPAGTAGGPEGTFWRSFMAKMEYWQQLTPKPASSVRIETVEPTPVAYVRHVGPYAGDPALFGRLFGTLCRFMGPRGLFGPATKMLTIYHEDPSITEEEKLRISVCGTVPEGTRPEGEVGVMMLDGGTFAVAAFELDPSEFGAAWKWLMGTWLPESGYQPDDRHCFELNLNDPTTHPEGKHVVELWEPVRPL